MQKCPSLQREKTCQKVLDKRGVKCYNMQAVNERPPCGGEREKDSAQNITKKVEKTFEKPLDKEEGM